MPELLLAIDAGTTTIRACLFTPGGDKLAQSALPVASLAPTPGRVEQDGAEIWQSARAVIAGALAGRSPGDIAAIGITTQRASAMLWDRQTGHPLTPLVVWSDLRGAERARELHEMGFPLSPQQSAAKLEALIELVENATELISQGRLAFGNIDAFLVFKLTGGLHVTDRSQAWPSGYLDLASLGWNQRLMAAQSLPTSLFPTLVDTWGEIGVTSHAVFGATVPVTAIVADQQAALIGHGGEAPGQAKVTYGTSAALDISTGPEFMWRGGAIPPFILTSVGSQTRFCLEGMVNSAGSALDWLRSTFSLGDHEALAQRAARTADAGGVAFLPALQGLGAPYGDLTRRANLAGLSLATGPDQIARAGLEGVAFRVREVFDHMFDQTGFAPPEILDVDGGLTASNALMQVQADLLARPVRRHAHREATTAGAALCAARGAGLIGQDTVEKFAQYDCVFEPRLSVDEADERRRAWTAQLGIKGAQERDMKGT